MHCTSIGVATPRPGGYRPGFSPFKRATRCESHTSRTDPHYAEAGSGSSAAGVLHRIAVEFAKRDIGQHGIRAVDESDVLRNAGDDHRVTVFDEAVRGNTDRFIFVFEKPEAPQKPLPTASG